MATRNIVPRANNEGQIGTTSKKWADIKSTLVNGGTLSGNNTGDQVMQWKFTVASPALVYAVGATIPIVVTTAEAITVTKVEVTLDINSKEIAGDLKWADAYIGLANATVINDFDTTSGVRTDTTITAGNVASGKCIYISFDSAPDASIKSACFTITYVKQ